MYFHHFRGLANFLLRKRKSFRGLKGSNSRGDLVTLSHDLIMIFHGGYRGNVQSDVNFIKGF